ncbi:MAG: hypothetical protein KAX56_08700 [Phenylobacterium sp.]|nr:hypothetical protein [Phenylobacterium sp.]
MLRDFSGGWDDYEARQNVSVFFASSMAFYQPVMARVARRMAREDVARANILLLGEQGLGDQVMFASMIPDLAATAAKLTCVCDLRLARLFSASFEGLVFQGLGNPPVLAVPPDATLLAMGSLGRLYRRGEADFPGTPHLRASAEVREAWATWGRVPRVCGSVSPGAAACPARAGASARWPWRSWRRCSTCPAASS